MIQVKQNSCDKLYAEVRTKEQRIINQTNRKANLEQGEHVKKTHEKTGTAIREGLNHKDTKKEAFIKKMINQEINKQKMNKNHQQINKHQKKEKHKSVCVCGRDSNVVQNNSPTITSKCTIQIINCYSNKLSIKISKNKPTKATLPLGLTFKKNSTSYLNPKQVEVPFPRFPQASPIPSSFPKAPQCLIEPHLAAPVPPDMPLIVKWSALPFTTPPRRKAAEKKTHPRRFFCVLSSFFLFSSWEVFLLNSVWTSVGWFFVGVVFLTVVCGDFTLLVVLYGSFYGLTYLITIEKVVYIVWLAMSLCFVEVSLVSLCLPRIFHWF